MSAKYGIEEDVNQWVIHELEHYGLVRGDAKHGYTAESTMSDKLKHALKGGAKTKSKTYFGKPDFEVECYGIPVIIEDKLYLKKLVAESVKAGLKMDDKSIENYAYNGALHYAQTAIDSGTYDEVIIVGVAGDSEDNITMKVGYVFGSNAKPKSLDIDNFSFIENEKAFEDMLKKARLTEEEQHKMLIQSKNELGDYAKKLNKLMNDFSISIEQRVIYVSGMLLSMQDVVQKDKLGNETKISDGLIPKDLKGIPTGSRSDGSMIVGQIQDYLETRGIAPEKVKTMMNAFDVIGQDSDKDFSEIEVNKEVGKWIGPIASINKQIFTFVYETVFRSIDGATTGAVTNHVDVMGEMYSEFLKYALGDGKNIGIVLTPPYVTKLMTQLTGVNMDKKVLDLATGSAGFLIASMAEEIADAAKSYSFGTDAFKQKVADIKGKQLMGVELDPKMYTLAATNMILRGDGSSHIIKGSAFADNVTTTTTNFDADVLLLNPPFSAEGNGMGFLQEGLKRIKKHAKAAIIIQDSVGSGNAGKQMRQQILKNNKLLTSIKMPTDLFQPSAGVQTSIYVFEAGVPHDFDETVRFIDFRTDGYKRTGRGTKEIDMPDVRYRDVLKIVKSGDKARIEADWGELSEKVVDDFITNSGVDWNYDVHQVIDTTVTMDDFMNTVGEYMAWQVSQKLKGGKA